MRVRYRKIYDSARNIVPGSREPSFSCELVLIEPMVKSAAVTEGYRTNHQLD